jgi:hypothetical protein
MLSVVTNIYNKKTKGPTLIELFTATGILKKFFWQLEMFDVCTTGDTAHIETLFKFLPIGTDHYSSEEYRCTHVDACVWQELEYRICVSRVTRGAHIERL